MQSPETGTAPVTPACARHRRLPQPCGSVHPGRAQPRAGIVIPGLAIPGRERWSSRLPGIGVRDVNFPALQHAARWLSA
jgi:hypothetical protein